MRIIILVAFAILTFLAVSCSQAQDDIMMDDASKDDFIDQVVQDNQKFRERNENLKSQIVNLNNTLNNIEWMNEILNDRVRNLERMLETPPSPQGNIHKEDISISDDEASLKLKNPYLAAFEDTGSMEPVINHNSLAIQLPVDDINVRTGDIVTFKSGNFDTFIVHRIIATGTDSEGWFAITKGDNNRVPDPEKIRKNDIIGITVVIIY